MIDPATVKTEYRGAMDKIARSVPMILLIAALALLIGAGVASAADAGDRPGTTLILPTDQLWALLAGVLSPAVGYVLNYYGKWVTEPVKTVVQLIIAAIAGGIAQAITVGDVGFNDVTLQYVVTAIIAALTAHARLWKPSTIAAKLGGGRNVQDDPAR